jgi:transposase
MLTDVHDIAPADTVATYGPDRVYLACGATDMRKSIDALAALVQIGFDLDPLVGAWFVFCNKDRDKMKLLRWDHNGWWLYYRRLERGRFEWPKSPNGARYTTQMVTRRQLAWLLDGLALEQKRAHPAVAARSVI